MKDLLHQVDQMIMSTDLIRLQAASYSMDYQTLQRHMGHLEAFLRRIREDIEQWTDECRPPKCLYCESKNIRFDIDKERYFCNDCGKDFGVK